MPLRIQKDKNIFFKLTILEYNFYNISFGFIIPDSCDTTLLEKPAYNHQYSVHAPSHEDPL